jgi:FkbM family methyltransferase
MSSSVILVILFVFILVYLIPSGSKTSETFVDQDIVEINHELYGNLRMIANDLITNAIGTDIIWEPHVVEVLAEHYVPGTDVLDVGCHSGLSMLGMHRLKPITGLVHCIESQSRQCEIIKYNLHGKLPYRLYNMALTDEPRIMCFDVVHGNTGGTGVQEKETQTCVAGLRLDDMMPFIKNRVSVVKMDVEGHEYQVLKSAKKFLERHRPVIEIEIIGHESVSKVSRLFTEMNYKLVKNMNDWDYVFVPTDK